MQIGVTERGEYKRCRRRWDYGSSNRQNLERLISGSPALPLGTVIHEALSTWLANPDDSLVDFYKLAAIKYNKECIERYTQQVGTAPAPEELEKMHTALLMGESMMANYQTFHGSPLPAGFELVMPEQEVSVPIPGTLHIPDDTHVYEPRDTAHCRYCGVARIDHDRAQSHLLRGRLDAIIANKKSDRLYILEHKTYGNRPRELVLRMNDQFIAYHWMLKQLNIGPTGGIAYDGMWKRAAPPKGNSLSDLFLRMPIEHTPAELDEFETMLAAEAIEMASNPPIYLNRTWDGSCDWGCNFQQLCLAQSRGEDITYVRNQHYAQRQPYEAKVYELA